MSSTRVEFCDTNILVYAHSLTSGKKRDQARKLVERLWDAGVGALSVQVLQELYVTLTRKASPSLSPHDARAIVADYARWRVAEPAKQDVLEAAARSEHWRVSFWDAMILVAAEKVGAAVVWSEDLNDGQRYRDTIVRSPFESGN